ncbi:MULTISPECIES: ECF transporter S component [unclassified Ligilactobacillus]|uniref:ECF transporter S component n=1 Tax=unclassified Ligilactobacillus TaxID=2767920 RepID=UPI003852BA94
MNTKKRLRKMVALTLLVAIIVVQNIVPFLGYIPIGPLSITVIPVTVAVAAVIFGPRAGALIGGIWGVIDWLRAFCWPTSPLAALVMVNPVVSVLPRVLVGVVAGMVFKRLGRQHRQLGAAVAAGSGALTNTVLVLGFIYLLYRGHAHALYGVAVHALLPYLLTVVATNGIPEVVLAMMVVPPITWALAQRGFGDRSD